MFGAAQSETVAHPAGRPACVAADSCACRSPRHFCVLSSAGQEVVFTATLLTAVRTTLLLYSVRPIVSALMLSSRTRMAPITIVILATYRLYQPDTRLMWSSYQRSTEVRNRFMSWPALLASACSDVLSVDIQSGSALMPFWISVIVVSPAALGTRRSTIASLIDLAEM